MNNPIRLDNYGPLAKYTTHEADRSRLIIRFNTAYNGKLIYCLNKPELAYLDTMIGDGRASLIKVEGDKAIYAVPMPERLPNPFGAMTADLEPVTAEFKEDSMIVTIQHYYNVQQFKRLLVFVGKHCAGYNTILPVPGSADGKITRFAVTFIDASAYAPDTALYKRIKALAGMYVLRITPRPEQYTKPGKVAGIASPQLTLF